MEEKGFTLGSPTHVVTVLACLLVAILLTLWGHRTRSLPDHHSKLRWGIALGSLLSWIATVAYGLQPSLFQWESALPLHFCNLANLIGAVAILYRSRIAQALLYFWSLSLCIWAFLTPFLLVGPNELWFWIFWIYHLFIPVCFCWILFIDGFRPGWKDLKIALIFTTGFTLSLAILNAFTGWDYGFVGPGKPGQPSPIDLLGPYPLRILWMLMIGAALFTLLVLPWTWGKKRKRTAMN
ncbi:MAG: TIGR02206 family membrane protein [Verrucomicrobiales bacterium]|nr:TIGR02206 family membrane protein [Verrucomicrobiales bacterium]